MKYSLLTPPPLCVQGSRADDEDGLSCDSGGRQARSHLPRTGYAPQPAESHDAKRWAHKYSVEQHWYKA